MHLLCLTRARFRLAVPPASGPLSDLDVAWLHAAPVATDRTQTGFDEKKVLEQLPARISQELLLCMYREQVLNVPM